MPLVQLVAANWARPFVWVWPFVDTHVVRVFCRCIYLKGEEHLVLLLADTCFEAWSNLVGPTILCVFGYRLC